jgi:UDP-N-acetylmuramyl pentapeptide phosphotransferase/UDP-N-acetylglucosamine-1-phosphate transferase
MTKTSLSDIRLLEATIATVLAAILCWWVSGAFGLETILYAMVLTAAGLPLFRRYALARPNARSSHTIPIPQGGGLAIILAILLSLLWQGKLLMGGGLSWVMAGMVLLALIGAVDDILVLPVLPRLSGQLIAVAMAIHGSAAGGQIFPVLPYGLEFVLLVVAGAWFVNLTNFMDGIDGITLAGFIPFAVGAVILGNSNALTNSGYALAVFFLAALIGFILFNYPRANIFLGDVGSLPIGLIGGFLVLEMAQRGAFAAAIILPLYHFSDATSTLLMRMRKGEKVWEAHREHAYQKAVDSGWSHKRVSGIILLQNAGLVGIALLTVGRSGLAQTALVALAAVAVTCTILLFRSRKRAA